MITRKLNANSEYGGSPHFHRIDYDPYTLLVQGYTADADLYGVYVPDGEDTVSVPALIAADAAAALDPRGMNFADLFRMLSVFGSSAFRLETLQHYETEGSAFNAWRATGEIPTLDDPHAAEWVGLVGRHSAAGHTMRRVHVTNSPLSEYLRYEFALQQTHSIPAGEHIRTVDAADASDFGRCGDFWLFDDRVGIEMIYDEGGRLTELYRMNTIEVERARSVRDAAWNAAGDLASVGVR